MDRHLGHVYYTEVHCDQGQGQGQPNFIPHMGASVDLMNGHSLTILVCDLAKLTSAIVASSSAPSTSSPDRLSPRPARAAIWALASSSRRRAAALLTSCTASASSRSVPAAAETDKSRDHANDLTLHDARARGVVHCRLEGRTVFQSDLPHRACI